MLVLAPMTLEAGALKLGAPGLRVRRTGVGPRRASAAAERLRGAEAGPVAIAGLCGALREDRQPGDLVVPRELHGPGGRVRAVDGPDPRPSLRSAGFVVHDDAIVGADHVVTGAERRELGRHGAGAVDMESLWLADAAPRDGLVVVRVVLDTPGHELMRAGTLIRLARALTRLAGVARSLSHWSPDAASVLSRSS